MTSARVNCGFEVKFSDDAPAGTFSGYGAVFDKIDDGGDVIAKGAFRDTLRDWKAKKKLPPMLLQHGGGVFGGGADDMVPIGKWTSMSEDANGLFVEGKLFVIETDRGKALYEAVKEMALDGLSIGYRVKEFTYGTKPDEPSRTLKKIDLWEVSLVTFPMNDSARISSVKSADQRTIREFEDFLRDVGGYSHAAAKAIARDGYKGRPDPRDEDGKLFNAALANLLRAGAALSNKT